MKIKIIIIIKILNLLIATKCFGLGLALEQETNNQLNKLPRKSQHGFVEVDNGKLFFQKFGLGKPIIILHGGPGLNQSYLLPQILELSYKNQVILYDQRGSGRSLDTLINSEYINLNQFTDDLDKLRISLGLEKFILFGHSWGGLLAIDYTIKHPNIVSKLIISNSAPIDYQGQIDFFKSFIKKSIPILNDIKPLLFNQDGFKRLNAIEISKLYRNLFSTYFYDQKNAKYLTLDINKKSAESGLKVTHQILSNYWLNHNSNLFQNLRNLKELKVKTLIIHGNQDIIPKQISQKIKDSMANAQIVYLDNCGHFPYIEKPSEFFSIIKLFLNN